MSVRLLAGGNHDGDANDSLLRGPAHCRTPDMSAHAQSWPFAELGTIPFTGGFLSNDAIAMLKNELVFRCAVQPYLWALPVLNMYGTTEGSASTHS
jgi:hypothetical protein